ncbi:hypothetical protein ABZZ17_30670 [Streptomyces sp. NPDC006512]|uniref:hypothetical protein n=1 Tax=Streptomyces sp. NPDC006512 TaxID=3154307 RepID=UPI0033B8EA75
MNITGGGAVAAVATLLVAALLSAGCTAAGPAGSATPKGRGATPSASADGSSSTQPPLTSRRLDAAELLTAALPDGETAPAGSSEKKVYERQPKAAAKTVGDPACVPVVDRYGDGPRPTTVIQTFASRENLEWNGTTVLTAHSEPASAAAEFSRLRQALPDCRDYRTPGAAGGTRTVLAPVGAPAHGDEAVAFTLTSWTDVSDINPDVKEVRTIRKVTVVRIGSVIAEFELAPSPSAETMEFPAELMARQVQRLRELR